MKIVVIIVTLSTSLFQGYFVSKWFWILSITAIFTAVTTVLNVRGKPKFYNDFPNSVRVFLATLAGVGFPYVLSILFFTSALFLNDELQRRVVALKGVIVLSGIDGTGKTTHEKQIYAYLAERGIQCERVHFTRYILIPKLHRLVRIMLRRTASPNPSLPGNLPDSEIGIAHRSARISVKRFRFYLALLDNILLFLVKVIPSIVRNKWVLCDRFIWDNCIKHKIRGYNVRGLHPLSILIKPWRCLIFDVPSTVAVERVSHRPDHIQYTQEQYDEERRFFRGLAQKFNYPIISTDQPIDKTRLRIEREVNQWL